MEEKIIESKVRRKRHNGLYVLAISTLLLISICMGGLIYAKYNPEGEIFGISFSTINERFEDFLAVFKEDNSTSKVDANVKYIHISNNYYKCEGNSISALRKGVVSKVSSDKDSYFILINYNNDVKAYYYDLTDVNVKENQALESGDSIGTYKTQFKVIFKKNNTIINYEDAISWFLYSSINNYLYRF